MLVSEILQAATRTNYFHNKALEAEGSHPHQKEAIQKALKQVGAGRDTEETLDTCGIQRLEQILVLNNDDLMEAHMSPVQSTLLRQIAMEVLENKMSLDPQWFMRKVQAHKSQRSDGSETYDPETRSESQ